jgi:hypothetical protein
MRSSIVENTQMYGNRKIKTYKEKRQFPTKKSDKYRYSFFIVYLIII